MVKKLLCSIFFFLLAISIYVDGSLLCSLIKTKNQPKYIRLALRPTGVTVSWTTNGYADVDDTPSPTVAYGTSSSALTSTSSTGFTTSGISYLVVKTFFHNVYLDGLQPSTKYYYRIMASSNCVDQSDVYSFITAPSAGTSANIPVNISIVGDLGLDNDFNQNQAGKTVLAMQKFLTSSNIFIHTGDIAYADLYGLVVDFKPYDDTWNTFQNNIQPISSYVPYQVGPGNHEATCFQYSDSVCPDYLRNFTAYSNRFCMSGDLSGGYKNMWYSFDYGPVHVIMLNTETDFTNAPDGPGTTLNAGNFVGANAQVTWLQADLAKATAPAQRAKVPWIIATGHRPFYGSTPNPDLQIAGQAIIPPSGNCDACRLAFLPLLNQYKVDFYFTGHVHWMELLYPLNATGDVVARNFSNADGVIHVTDGAGGAPSGAETIDVLDADRQAWFFGGYGFHQLLIQDSSHAILNFIDSSTATVIKSVDILRNH